MIFAIAAALGLVLAIARGVSLAEIAGRKFYALGLLGIAFGLHMILSPLVMPAALAKSMVFAPIAGLPTAGNLLYLVSLACALVFLSLNRRVPGFALILVGLGLNFAVIAAAGGQMPGDPVQLERAGLLGSFLARRDAGHWSPFTLLEPGTPLPFLADVIYVPMPFRSPTIISVGDIFIALGVVGFFSPLRLARKGEAMQAPAAR